MKFILKSIRFPNKINAFSTLNSVSPLDGRYSQQTTDLQSFFSERALMKYRIRVQSQWLLHLVQNKIIPLNKSVSYEELEHQLSKLWKNFDDKEAKRVKQIESITNHDLKSVEYYIKEKIPVHKEDIHFCCTSEDINNLSYSLMLKDALREVIEPNLKKIHHQLVKKSEEYSDHGMLGRTHGQPATPTTLGKEFANFSYRIGKQINYINETVLSGKINGAVGNYNAHYFSFPEVNWLLVCETFVQKRLELSFNPYTTQIQSHDSISRLYNEISLANTILIGLCRDIWEYTSKQYLKQKSKTHEVGSSTMPHKVNPIDFENCEGNLGLANSIMNHFKDKLPISRLQRDLSDSTVLRNQGSALGYSLIGYKSLLKGLSKVSSNKEKMLDDLSSHFQVITEAIQTELRKVGYPEPYELLKKISRGMPFTESTKQELVQKLRNKISQESLEKIKNLHPEEYLGKASYLAQKVKDAK